MVALYGTKESHGLFLTNDWLNNRRRIVGGSWVVANLLAKTSQALGSMAINSATEKYCSIALI